MQGDARIKEWRADLDTEKQLVADMREQVEDAHRLTESWIEAFDMALDDDGKWTGGHWIKDCLAYHDRYIDLLKQWDKFVPKYNAAILRRNVGRPLEQVLKLQLRGIAEETSFRLPMVRTITSIKHLQRIDPDRELEASWRAGQRRSPRSPRRINETLAKGRQLVKQARGFK